MGIDVLFIHPADHRKVYQELSLEFTAVAPPVWTSLLANYTRKRGYSTAISDITVEGWDANSPGELLSRYSPSLVVMMVYGHQPSASTQTMPAARRIAHDLKNYSKDVLIAMGGTHPSALPERTLREEEIDFVIQGEGALTITGLLNLIKSKGNLQEIPGLCYWKNGAIEKNAPATIIENLDEELDDYAWDLLPPLSSYRAHNFHCFQYFQSSQKADFSDVRTPYVTMNTSLGCPYLCTYCCINAIFGKPKIRYWSLEKVMSWIDYLVIKKGVRNIRFDDELFILSPSRVERFCDLLIERQYDLNIYVYGRVDTIREPMLPKLRKAGFRWICLGIESANELVRQDVNKNIKGDIRKVVRMLREYDINVLGNYMFGLPNDNMETMEETLRLAMDLTNDFANFYTVMGYPGSELYRWVADKGYLPEAWEGFSQHSYDTRPLPTKYLTATDVLRFRDEAYLRYFTDIPYLDYMKTRFGPKVKEHLEKMTRIKLKRRLLGDLT